MTSNNSVDILSGVDEQSPGAEIMPFPIPPDRTLRLFMQVWDSIVEEARALVESVYGHVVDFDELVQDSYLCLLEYVKRNPHCEDLREAFLDFIQLGVQVLRSIERTRRWAHLHLDPLSQETTVLIPDTDEILETLAASIDPDAALLRHQLGPGPGEFELLENGDLLDPDYVRFVQSGGHYYRTTGKPLRFTRGKSSRRYKQHRNR